METIREIEREAKLYIDFRTKENIRYKIYELAPYWKYMLIVYKDGEIIKIAESQNALTLVLNHIN